MEHFDVVVEGAGLVGAAVGYELSAAGANKLVVEAGPEPAPFPRPGWVEQMAWLLEHNERVAWANSNGSLGLGTLDTWLPCTGSGCSR